MLQVNPLQRWRALMVCALSSAIAMPPTIVAQSTNTSRETLRVVVTEGGGAINNIAARTARDPVVRVLDADGKPISGATVTFTAPSTGPGGAFVDGSPVFTAQTNADGIAAARGLKPNKTPGQFPIRVLATSNGRTGRATLLQTNATPAAANANRKKILIAGLVAGAVAGGVLAASHGKSTAAATPVATAAPAPVPGSPTFTPPQ